MSNAVRQRRKSQRRKAGLIVLDVEVHENAFAEALINSDRLTPEETRCVWYDLKLLIYRSYDRIKARNSADRPRD
jgi:hypothetical protein